MSTEILDGKTLKTMLIGGTEFIRTNIAEINDLNVFPVPDGDTGTNMTKTLEGGISEISEIESESISGVMEKFAHGVLLGARGNSGVILSQIFVGIKEELEKFDKVTAIDLSNAYKNGIAKSYSAVVNPTEGTILTVFRESTEYAASKIDESSTIDEFYRLHIEEAKRSLERTKELLPVLAEADVVDSGAAGYLCIAIGMLCALTGKTKIEKYSFADDGHNERIDLNKFKRDSELKYGYCTEFLLRLTDAKCDPDSFDKNTVISLLESLSGESIVCYKTDDMIKVHVHTFCPGEILEACQRFGEFLTVKIENMSLSHTEEKKEPPKKKSPYSVIAVAVGDGICSLLSHMGSDEIISGGQTANPSTEEFIEAFERCNSDNIIVLPNNKNVFLAAKQASELYDKAKIHIIPTENVMQGYGALSVITPGITDIDTLVRSASTAARSVLGLEITRAVRDVTIGGTKVTSGDFIAIKGHDIAAVSESAEAAVLTALSQSIDTDDYELLTLFVGKDVSEDGRADLTERLEEEFPDLSLTVYEGGQEVYDYLIALE